MQYKEKSIDHIISKNIVGEIEISKYKGQSLINLILNITFGNISCRE